MRPLAALLALASLSLGCGATYVQRHLLARPGRPHTRPVRAILEGDPVPPAEAVAIVQSTARGLDADLPHVLAGLRAEAQRLGCDALVLVRIARAHSTATGVALAVRWTGHPPGVTRPGPVSSVAAPWAPPPPLDPAPATAPPPAPDGAPPPWSAP